MIWEDDDTPNIVSNPSFEDGEYPWYPWAPFQGETNWEIASDYSYGGSYSAKAGPFEPPDERIKYENYAQGGSTNPMPLPGTPFVLSAWVKIDGATDSASVGVEFWNQDYTGGFPSVESARLKGTHDWALISVVVTDEMVPNEAKMIKVHLKRWRGAGIVWFDEVRLEGGTKRSSEVKYVYASGRHMAKIVDGAIFYYHLDPLGSPAVITDANGNEVKRYDYYAFGDLRSESGYLQNTHKFTGKEEDETDLYYYGARYYDASIGRFVMPDLGAFRPTNPQSLNLYIYCYNNPLRLVDPDGEEPISTAALTALTIATLRTGEGAFAGGLTGLAVQGYKDIFVYHRFSDWESYAGSAMAGAVGGAIGIWFGFEPGALGVGLVAARYAGEDVFGRIIASAIQTKGQVIYFQWFGKTYTIFDEAGLVKDGKIRIKNEDGTVTVIDMKTGKVTHEKPDDQNSQDKQQQKKTEPENPAERAEAEAKTPYDPWTGEGWWW